MSPLILYQPIPRSEPILSRALDDALFREAAHAVYELEMRNRVLRMHTPSPDVCLDCGTGDLLPGARLCASCANALPF